MPSDPNGPKARNNSASKRQQTPESAESVSKSVSTSRRSFIAGAVATSAVMAAPRWAGAEYLWPTTGPATNVLDALSALADDDLAAIRAEITKRHDESLRRMQTWIQQPSIAAENRGMNEGCELTMQLFREAGFQQVSKVPTDGQPGIFATLDAGAAKTLGLYFMYDVKQVDPAEWSSPPWEAKLVDKPGFGKVVMGRGAVNQKGPEAGVSGSVARHQRLWEKTSGQPGNGGGRRRRNRVATFSASRPPAGSAGSTEKSYGNLYAFRGASARRTSHDDIGR